MYETTVVLWVKVIIELMVKIVHKHICIYIYYLDKVFKVVMNLIKMYVNIS